jgi:hypothetical protein
MSRWILILTLTAVTVLAWPLPASAQERLCDTQYEDCKTPLLDLINREGLLPANAVKGIDVAFWYMTDSRFVTALKQAKARGVPIRILVDDSANTSHTGNATILQSLADPSTGLPMRNKITANPYILHFKMMLFHGLDTVQFSKSNYTHYSFVPHIPNVDYQDEVIFFSDDPNVTNSFRRRFDDLWVDTVRFANYANVTENPPQRRYPLATIHPSVNFSPSLTPCTGCGDFINRAVARVKAEPQRIDAMAFRITSNRMSDAVLQARLRGIPVRLLMDPDEYRDPDRLWHAKHVDKFWAAGVEIKQRDHLGVLHQMSIVLPGLGEAIFGSSNWTDASGNQQDEHNYFYSPSLNKPWMFQWFAEQFENKWNDTAGYVPFYPQPPGTPQYIAPQNVSSGVGSSVTLKWDGGTWGHLYDIYFGTNPNPPLVPGATNLQIGSPVSGTQETYAISNLLPGTTYYWRIVGKTWAASRDPSLVRSGPVWSFTTAGAPPPPPPGGNPATTPYGGTPAAIPGIVQVENFDVNGQSSAYFDTDGPRPGSPYRTTNVDIGSTADANSNGHYVGWTRVGEWLVYTVNVTQTRTYNLTVRVANVGSGAKFRVDVDNASVTGSGVALPNTLGWDTWQDVTISIPNLTQGQHVVRLVMVAANTGSNGVGNYGYLKFD